PYGPAEAAAWGSGAGGGGGYVKIEAGDRRLRGWDHGTGRLRRDGLHREFGRGGRLPRPSAPRRPEALHPPRAGSARARSAELPRHAPPGGHAGPAGDPRAAQRLSELARPQRTSTHRAGISPRRAVPSSRSLTASPFTSMACCASCSRSWVRVFSSSEGRSAPGARRPPVAALPLALRARARARVARRVSSSRRRFSVARRSRSRALRRSETSAEKL